MQRPRAMVLDEAWRRLPGVAALSGPDGGPLRRTVKLIVDPLVIRPVQHPSLARPLLDADAAALLTARLHAHSDRLRATAAWFTLLKQIRRSLRITDGNPQDLYFQRCFELATTDGEPDPLRGRARAERVLADLHATAAGRTTQALKRHLTDPAHIRALTTLISVTWGRRLVGNHPDGPEPQVTALLNARAAGNAEFDSLIRRCAGAHFGVRLWTGETSSDTETLGLSSTPLPTEPRLGTGASTSTLALPFDRSIFERIFTVLQTTVDRAELPAVPDLVRAEIARSCAPWALLDETLRVAATVGVGLARGLHPITTAPTASTSNTAAHRVINSRWRREAYVLQAHRLAVCLDGAPDPDNPLAVLATELRTPWRPYLRRLWVRLHGRDVRGAPLWDAAELSDILDGVARSVILDHRMRVKQTLSLGSKAS